MTTLPLRDDLDLRLDETGTAVTLPCGTTRVFDDPDSVWFIREGTVDLFAVQRRNGVQTGPREHMCALSAGSLIWGIDQEEEEDGIHLVALCPEATVLSRVDVATIEQWGTDQVLAGPLSDALDPWITGLNHGVTRHISPRRTPRHTLVPGEESPVAETERVISRRNVTWATFEGGTAFFIDIKEIGGDGKAAYVPLTPQGWLRAGSIRSVRGLSTESVLRFGQIRSRMDLFHNWIFHLLPYGFRNVASKEAARMRLRKAAAAEDTSSILGFFSRLFDKEIFHKVDKGSDDALFLCCRLVGRALSAEISAPAAAKRRRAEEAPVTIEDIASASRMRIRRVALRDQWWRAENGPMVGFLAEQEQPVALLQRSPGTMVLHDPVSGEETVITEAVADSLAPMAYTFYAGFPERQATAADLLRLCLRYCRRDLLLLFLTGAVGGIVSMSIPVATGYVFDEIIPGHQLSQLFQVAIAIAIAAWTATVFEFARSLSQLRIEGRIAGVVQAALMDRLLRLPSPFFAEYSSGDLAQRALSIEAARKNLTGMVLGSMVTGIFSLFNLALLVYYAPLAALLAISLLAVLVAVAVFTGRRILSVASAMQELAGKMSSLVLELVGGINKIRIAGAEDRAFHRWAMAFGRYRNRMNQSRRIQIRYGTFWMGYEVLCLCSVFVVVGITSRTPVTTGAFLAFVAAFTGLLSSVYALCRSLIEVMAAVPLYRRALPLLTATPEADVTKADPGRLGGDIEVNSVTFRYAPNLPNILNGVTLSISAGEMVALVGPSGSGKSTLARLLLGLNRPDSGAIYFDGRDLRGLNLQSVRRQIGSVLQNGRLMPGSLFENIRGIHDVTIDECWAVAAQVGLADDIEAMPMRMHTMLTDGASTLSGGQVQRLLIARALVGKPAVLLFDEATSALDNETQAVVMKTLDHISVTRIVIAHRLSTVRNADRIYVLKDGEVRESGTYSELLEGGDLFTALAYRQRL
ncbi:MAG: NHLP bacteriocin export ABC transporter permease/ATPase subunit [Telmatospirillum sp.]|nr:NHLP bacteriocin export ABC transporter permease/ATPase subunit [Telmatospirillum sp.]